MRASTTATPRPPPRSSSLAARAFLLGFASPVLIFLGWLWFFPAFYLAVLAAVFSIFYAARALRAPRGRQSKVLATTGALPALLTLSAVVLFFVWLALNPPE
jgi:hypothetical protein